MKRLLLIAVILLSTQIAFTQKRDADSLYTLLNSPMEDTLRVITMRNLSLAMYTYDPDSALTIAYDGLQHAKKINFRAGISRMYEMIGIILTKTGNFNKAISYYIENLKIEESLQSQDGIISANNNLGILYVYLHDYENALKSYTKANTLLATFKSEDLEYVTDLRYMIN
ncbi:MAG: tetratricopeptide repeat protein, partial [Chitinophagaceae bacterium]|nr:tetratricopeptide repeat protein [Chitinophagaceae bacterium]